MFGTTDPSSPVFLGFPSLAPDFRQTHSLYNSSDAPFLLSPPPSPQHPGQPGPLPLYPGGRRPGGFPGAGPGVTGILEVFYYIPTPGEAALSIQTLTFLVPFGGLVRNLHFWAAQFLVIVSAVHLLRVIFTGAYLPPRRFNYLLGHGVVRAGDPAGFHRLCPALG